MDHEQMETFERNAIWRSFFALVAFMVFFMLERVINILGEVRERRRRRRTKKRREENKDADVAEEQVVINCRNYLGNHVLPLIFCF